MLTHALLIYTVKSGNTLSSIARNHNTTWQAIAVRNHLPNPNEIQPGQKLRIRKGDHRTPYVRLPEPAAPPAATFAPASPSSTPVTAAPGGGFQSCVIQAESGGNASAVNASSGAGGLYGFLPSTWQGLGYSGLPQNASVAEQNAAYAKEYAQGGTSAWAPYDHC